MSNSSTLSEISIQNDFIFQYIFFLLAQKTPCICQLCFPCVRKTLYVIMFKLYLINIQSTIFRSRKLFWKGYMSNSTIFPVLKKKKVTQIVFKKKLFLKDFPKQEHFNIHKTFTEVYFPLHFLNPLWKEASDSSTTSLTQQLGSCTFIFHWDKHRRQAAILTDCHHLLPAQRPAMCSTPPTIHTAPNCPDAV